MGETKMVNFDKETITRNINKTHIRSDVVYYLGRMNDIAKDCDKEIEALQAMKADAQAFKQVINNRIAEIDQTSFDPVVVLYRGHKTINQYTSREKTVVVYAVMVLSIPEGFEYKEGDARLNAASREGMGYRGTDPKYPVVVEKWFTGQERSLALSTANEYAERFGVKLIKDGRWSR